MIQFYLQADPCFDKEKLRIRRYWQFSSVRAIERGQAITEINNGLVDEDVIAQNKDEYSKFDSFVNANDARLYEEAKKTPGVPYLFDYNPKPEVLEVKAAVSDKKSKKDKANENN